QFGQEVANRVEDGVVTAARAPPDLGVGGEVLGLLRLVRGGHPVVPGGCQTEVRARQTAADQVSHYQLPLLPWPPPTLRPSSCRVQCRPVSRVFRSSPRGSPAPPRRQGTRHPGPW